VRARFAAALLAFVLVPVAAGAAVPFRALLKTPSTQPRVNVDWHYSVRVTDRTGHPIRATITAQIVDTFGGVHAVQYDGTTRNIVNRPFRGTFRDYLTFPPESRGFTLTLKLTIKAKGAKRVLERKVTPR
jgi:hypothetical protein